MKLFIQLHSNIYQNNINSLPWLLMEKQINFVKEVIQKINFPTRFCSNMNNIITKKGDFVWVKTHDWHVFIKVLIMVYIYCYIFYSHAYYCWYFLVYLLKKIMKQFLYCYNMFDLYLSQTSSKKMSNNLYMILENTWGKWWYLPCIKRLFNSW